MLFRPRKRRILGQPVRACLAFGSLFVLTLWMPAAAQTQESGPPGSDFDLNEMRIRTVTKTREMTIGRQLTRRFERRIRLVKDVAVQEYVDRIAQDLARHSDAIVPVTIKVVDSTELSAVSFPGGFLYISSGLILAMDDEAEIASVVAHEIAHVVARDGMRNNRYMGTGGGGAEFILIPFPNPANALAELDGLTPLISLGSPREIRADYRAIQYMQRAGYDPKGMIRFLEKLQARETTEAVLLMLQTHPPAAERIRLAQEQIGASPSTDSVDTGGTTELQKIKALLVERETSNPRPE